jgi:hypothetical protein
MTQHSHARQDPATIEDLDVEYRPVLEGATCHDRVAELALGIVVYR